MVLIVCCFSPNCGELLAAAPGTTEAAAGEGTKSRASVTSRQQTRACMVLRSRVESMYCSKSLNQARHSSWGNGTIEDPSRQPNAQSNSTILRQSLEGSKTNAHINTRALKTHTGMLTSTGGCGAATSAAPPRGSGMKRFNRRRHVERRA
jgi:hypothetical protein